MNPGTPRLARIASLKSVADFRAHVAGLGLDLPCEERIDLTPSSSLARPCEGVLINGKRIANRVAVQPMEGWDPTATGGPTDDVRRRWQRFGERFLVFFKVDKILPQVGAGRDPEKD